MIDLHLGDCLEVMKEIPDGSVDCVITDLPYGTTACKWDVVIPFDKLWEQFGRVCKDTSPIVLFGSQPFTSLLITSNMSMFRYRWIWDKIQGSNFQLSNVQPMSVVEDICVFGKAKSANGAKRILVYNPQKTNRPKPCKSGGCPSKTSILNKNSMVALHKEYTDKFPVNILQFKRDSDRVHPTQKPVALIEYLIRTYTTEGETVLDATMGSGTTGVACVNTNRNFIGIEKEPKYFEIAKSRIGKAQNTPRQEELGI